MRYNMAMLDSEYIRFNQWIYQHFLSDLEPFSNIVTAFSDINDIKNQDFNLPRIGHFLARCRWADLCRNNHDIPAYLGLIAIQLLAAASRNDSEDFTARAYNPELKKLLFFSRDNELQASYRSGQAMVYENFEQWCDKKNYSISLSKNSRWCYCQYPLSLSLLHKKDIESLSAFFNLCGFAPNDDIDFSYLKVMVESRKTQMPAGIRRKWDRTAVDLEIKEALLQQIYAAYLNWDGKYTENTLPRSSANEPIRKIYSLFWPMDASKAPIFYTNGTPSKLLERKGGDTGCFYIQDSMNIYDWESINILSEDIKNPVIYVYGKESMISNAINQIDGIQTFSFGALKIQLLDSECIRALLKFQDQIPGIKREKQIRLFGGIKTGYRTWMYGTGPRIAYYGAKPESFQPVLMTSHGEKDSVDITAQPLVKLSPGKYYLRYSAVKPAICFEIQYPDSQENRRRYVCGWQFSETGFHVTPSPMFNGLDFSAGAKLFKQRENCGMESNQIREWLHLTGGAKSIKKTANKGIINQILRRAQDGICNR